MLQHITRFLINQSELNIKKVGARCNASGLFSEGAQFDSKLAQRLSCLRCLWTSSLPLSLPPCKRRGSYLRLREILALFFPVQYPVNVVPFGAGYHVNGGNYVVLQ